MKLTILTLTLFITSAAQASNPGAFDLRMQITRNEKIIASSKITVKDGEMGSLVSESEDSKTYFDITATERNISGSKGIFMKLEIAHVRKDGSKTIVTSPSLLAKVGKESVVLLQQDGVKGEDELFLKVIAVKKPF